MSKTSLRWTEGPVESHSHLNVAASGWVDLGHGLRLVAVLVAGWGRCIHEYQLNGVPLPWSVDIRGGQYYFGCGDAVKDAGSSGYQRGGAHN